MSPVLAAGGLFGLVSAACGFLIVRGSSSRCSGALLVIGGLAIVSLLALALLGVDPEVGLIVTAFSILPWAFVTYPELTWAGPLRYLLIVVAGGAGALAVTWSDSRDAMMIVVGCVLLVHAWSTLEFGAPAARRPMAWATAGWVSSAVVAAALSFLAESMGLSDTWLEIAAAVGIVLIATGPVAMTVGVVRPDVVDVRGLITSVVVVGTVFTIFVAVASAVAAIIEILTGRPPGVAAMAVACAVIGFGVRPLGDVLRGVIDQLLFGRRPDPLSAARDLADRIGQDATLALSAVREALVLPYATLVVDGETLATSGTPVPQTRAIALRIDERVTGTIVVGLRAADLRLSADDEQVLRIVAPLLASAIRTRALAADLAASRGEVVVAIEEERRRLRRDLHDGLGPTLTGVAFAVDAARNQLAADPSAADALLAELRDDISRAIVEVRRLVEGLRPPALDELGLVAALRAWASRLHSDSGRRLDVLVEAPDDLSGLSAASEAAAFRIAVEALTNVARHSGSPDARVDLVSAGGELQVTVTDSGRGMGDRHPGVGLTSMRERAALLGGTLEIRTSDSGSVVRARIPV